MECPGLSNPLAAARSLTRIGESSVTVFPGALFGQSAALPHHFNGRALLRQRPDYPHDERPTIDDRWNVLGCRILWPRQDLAHWRVIGNRISRRNIWAERSSAPPFYGRAGAAA